MIIFSEEDLVEVFDHLEDIDFDEHDLSAINEIRIIVGNYQAKTWQATLRFRNANLPWSIGVSDNPGDALVNAFRKVGKPLEPGGAYYYPKRSEAEEYRTALGDIYGVGQGGAIAWTKTEFEPSKGFVVVVCPNPGEKGRLKKLEGKVEFRLGEVPTNVKEPASTPAPPAGGSPMSKSDMEGVWKAKHGKNPDRNIKKADLWDRLVEQGLVEPSRA